MTEGGDYKTNAMPSVLPAKAEQDALSSNLADSDSVLPNKNSDGDDSSNGDLAESDTSHSLLSEKKKNRQRRRANFAKDKGIVQVFVRENDAFCGAYWDAVF